MSGARSLWIWPRADDTWRLEGEEDAGWRRVAALLAQEDIADDQGMQPEGLPRQACILPNQRTRGDQKVGPRVRSIWKEEVAPDERLWRYFLPDRFLETLRTKSLHFPSARQFDDPFEGAVAVLPNDWPTDPRYGEVEDGEWAFEQLRRLTKLSCWHRAAYESAAMWKLYAADAKGVAITTTAARLRTSLQPFRLAANYGEEEPWWGSVRYVDLHKERLRASMMERFFYKHRAFEWEREFRLAISLRMAEEFAVEVPEFGIDVAFDAATLIESVYLGPGLTYPERAAMIEACKTADIRSELVHTSTLLGRPRYT